MYKNILVCLDGSGQDKPVSDMALWLAKQLGATLQGLHVMDVLFLEGPWLYDLSGSLALVPQMNIMQEARKALELKGKTLLSNFESLCQEQQIPCKTLLEEGVVHRLIIEKTELHDLTLIGRRGLHYRFDKELLGSTADRVVRHTKAPTLVMTHEFQEIKSPLLAYDGSHEARKALTSAVRLLGELKLPLTVLHVSEDAEQGRQILEQAKEYLDPYPIPVKYECIPGTPRHEVPEYVKKHHHDLTILGARGHRGLMDLILGSTTEYMLWQGTAPVLVDR